MDPSAVWRVVRGYAEVAGLVGVKPHDFRRFVGTQLAAGDIRKAQKGQALAQGAHAHPADAPEGGGRLVLDVRLRGRFLDQAFDGRQHAVDRVGRMFSILGELGAEASQRLGRQRGVGGAREAQVGAHVAGVHGQ